MTRTMDQSTLSRLVARYVAAWNSHDVNRIASLFAEDASCAEFGQGKVLLGPDEIRRYLTTIFRAVPDLTTTPTGHPVQSGERVLCEWIMTGTPKDEFAGVPASGKRFEVRGATVFVTSGTKILRAADVFDLTSVARQLRPGREGRWHTGTTSPDVSASDFVPRQWLLADEDNIGYGE